MKRRTFLQRMGCLLAVLGWTEAEWLTLGNPYYQALAQPNSRKLALLVGINQYPSGLGLSGCLTDVELQRELLIHRFGFTASDILTLTEEQASREFIEAAILDHLGQQAKTDDVVFFHFSGYGTRVQLPGSPEAVENALIPVDYFDTQKSKFVNYLLTETLILLLRSLPTDKVTAVLDTSYYTSPELLSHGLGMRARPELTAVQLAPGEIEFLQQLKSQKLVTNNGLILSATSEPHQVAREFIFGNVSAGLFTYALTQYLWETTPATTIQVLLSHVGSSMYQFGNKQQPSFLSSKKNIQNSTIIDNFPFDKSSAEGVVTGIEDDGKIIQLFLGGIPPQVWEYYGVNSRFSLATGEQLVIKSRTGLTAKTQIVNPETNILPNIGQLVQETIRVLPRNINLTVALAPELERIERVDATSAFANISRIANVISTEPGVDYVFGKLPQTSSRYGLFSPANELIVNSAGEAGEAVKVAVQRLTPKLSTLLAAKLWRLTENEGSSRLPVKVSLEIVNNISPRIVLQRETWRNRRPDTTTNKAVSSQGTAIPTVPVGSRMVYRVQNLSDRSLYFILVGLNNSRSAIAFYPWQTRPETALSEAKPQLQEILIPPGQTLTLPQNDTISGWLLPSRPLLCEHQLIFSTSPFHTTLAALSTAKYSAAEPQPISSLINALEVAQAILEDIHNASEIQVDMNNAGADAYIFNVNNWASLNFSFQVV
ncbi:caspase family protein [Richelia sinica]|nr:caspase family protein [Richelia sinica]MBD2667081.1 caspase family protein [Richelia sinica FACHB-800]